MATETGPLEDVRLEELLRILEAQKSASATRREKFQAKLRHLKERQDNLQYRIVSRMNKDGIHIDIDTIKKRAQQAILDAPHDFDNDDDAYAENNEKTNDFYSIQESSDTVYEERANEGDAVEDKTEAVPVQANTNTNTNAEKSRKLSSKTSSAQNNTKLEKIQEETTEQSNSASKIKVADVKEKKVAVKNGKKVNAEKRFKNAVQATKFVAKVSKRKTTVKLKEK